MSEQPVDESVSRAFWRLSDLIHGGADEQAIYQALVDTALLVVPGCDHASLLLKERDHYRTAASTDDIARRIDGIEVEVGEGPCVDALTDEAYQHDGDLTRGENPWPTFAKRIVDETPVRSAIGYRLTIEGDKVGALNLFSDVPGGLTSAAADAGAVIAAFSSVALMALRSREQVSSLRAGLTSNREIGKAVGLLMAAHKISSDEAFERLRRTSQDLNMKLAQVAARVVEGQDVQLRR